MEFSCVQCGFRINTLFVQYSPGNIRLMKCENCKAVADEYIECEIMILLIDLILHKPKAYRHLLYNMLNREMVNFEGLLWTSTFGFLLLDSYRILVLNRSEGEWGLSISFSSLVWSCGKMLMDVFFGNFMFLCILLLATRILLNTVAGVSGYKDLLLAILISSYFKIFLIAMMVWEFPSSVIFIIDIFVLSSNTVALKVITESAMSRCIGVCFSAHAVKFFAYQVIKFVQFGIVPATNQVSYLPKFRPDVVIPFHPGDSSQSSPGCYPLSPAGMAAALLKLSLAKIQVVLPCRKLVVLGSS